MGLVISAQICTTSWTNRHAEIVGFSEDKPFLAVNGAALEGESELRCVDVVCGTLTGPVVA